MIAGIFHKGSGLGNQLHRYVATRVLAKDKGHDFTMVGVDNFKGKDFMNLDMGVHRALEYHVEMPAGKVVVDTDLPLWEEKTNYYNPEFNFIQDNTVIDGEFQDERYFEHRLNEIDQWLKVEPIDIPDDVCLIGFRGGEFKLFPDLFLTYEYWRDAIKIMLDTNPDMRFEIHTDDLDGAVEYFKKVHGRIGDDLYTGDYLINQPSTRIIHDIGINWKSMRSAKYAIIANSSFYILPRLLKHSCNVKKFIDKGTKYKNQEENDEAFKKTIPFTIAPRYWARHNTKEWSMPQNYYKSFKYV